jgi:hypothetical protein
MAFRRVQHATGPKHIFYVSEQTLTRWPENYRVVDDTVHAEPGPVDYGNTEVPKKSGRRSRSRTAAAPISPADDHSAVVAPLTGVQEEGEPRG